MDGIGLNGFGKICTDRTWRRVSRIGRAHNLPITGNRVLSFEYLNHDRPGDHVFHKIIVERPFSVHGVELLRLGSGQVNNARRQNLQAP